MNRGGGDGSGAACQRNVLIINTKHLSRTVMAAYFNPGALFSPLLFGHFRS